MKQCVYVIIFTSILVLWSTGLSGCKECNDVPSYTEDKFIDLYPGYMGFEGHETLSFLKNSKDTVYYKGQGLQVYNETKRFPNGDCEVDVNLLNHKVVFNSKNEGSIIFHYYKDGKQGYDTYEIIFQNEALLKPTEVNKLSFRPLDSAIVVLGHEYKNGWRFSPNETDSIYFDGDKDPRYKVVRIRIKNEIYEVIP